MKLIKLFFLVICCSFLMIGCDNKSKEQNLIVATSADNPPYEFIQNGQIVGFDIDIINAIGEQIGKKVIIKNFDFNGLLASLTTENVDIVIAGLSVTEERKKHISFSVPYISTNVSILYRSADNLKNTGDLDNKAVGVQLGTTWAVIVQDLAKQFNIRINYLSNNLMLVEELKSKVIDVVVLEASQSKKFIENNPDLASFGLTEFSSELAIAMPKNSKLIDSVNKAIAELTEDGTISRITKKMASTVNSERFKQALSTLPTGVTIISTLYNNKLFGFTADSFTSVSLLPPLVSFCLDKQAFSMSAFTSSKYFAVSILAEDQEDISRHFSKFNTDKFAGISYNLGCATNCPLIEGAVCHIECNKFSQYEVGDHVILVGEVINTIVNSNLNPLVHCLRQYRGLK